MRKLSLLLLACLTLGIAWAERVSVNTAQQVAANVAAGLSPSNLRSSSDLKLVYAAPAKQQSGLRAAGNESDYYIFNVGTGDGFIIVAGEDRVRPVLGYSAEGEVDMERMPENMKAWLEMYQREISWAVSQGISASGDVEKEWQEVLNGTTNLRAVDPPLETAHWAQGEPYNWMTPAVNGIQTVTGCVATAQAIVMKYYEYPERAIVASTNSTYKINGAEHTAVINYDAYDWANMLDEYEEGRYNEQQGNAVAKLMWHCGANVAMNYGTGASGASAIRIVNSLKNIFGYSQSIQYVEKMAYCWADWTALFKNELDNGRPVIVSGNDGAGGHAFVCDGYNSKNHFHINWGWGFSFGYFLLSSLDDDYDGQGYAEVELEYGAIIGIQPEGGEPVEAAPFIYDFYYAGRPGEDLPESLYLQAGYFYSCTEAISCWNGLAVVDENNQIIQTPTYYSTHIWDAIGGYYQKRQQYSITLEKPLSEGERIAMVYSTDEGATWHVTRVGAEVPLGLNNEGMIYQDLDDPGDQEEPVNMNIVWNQFDDAELEVITDGSTYSFDNTQAFSLNIGGLKTDAWMGISVEDSASWVSHLRIYYGSSYDIYKENAGTLATGENGKWWIPVSLSDVENNYYMPYLKVLPDKAGTIDYDIQLYSEDKKTLLVEVKGQQMKTVGADVPTQPITWTFIPDKLEGIGGSERWFSIVATNVGDYEGQKPMISLNIEGSLSDEVAVSYVTSDFTPIQLNVTKHPDWPDGNLCITTPYEVEALTEGKEYKFIFRYIGGFTGDLPENGDIQLESVTVNGTALELDPNAGVEYILTAPEKDIEVSGKEVFYEESHKGKVVNVYSDGIYIVNEPNASIKELRIQPGGQVSLLQELDIEVLNISHFIPTSKWTTFGAPNASEKIVFGDGEGTLLEDGTVESRIGYSSTSQQEWIKSLESDFQPGFAALFAHSTSNGELGFHRAQETTGVMTLPVRVDAGEINKPNGNWFRFVANPNWENLQIQGRAYVLDDSGLNFALRENPIIKPFEAYMVASDEVMANVSNLRIGDIPTSNEDLAVTGFRVWTESGHVCFETTEAKDVAVYSMNGVQQCRFERSVGVQRQQLPQGIYIVVCDGTAYKVSVK